MDDGGQSLEVVGWSRSFPDNTYTAGTGSDPEATPTTTTLNHVFVSQKYVDENAPPPAPSP